MTRYYFDVRDNDRLFPDDQGMELESLDDAVAEAETVVAEMAKDVLPGSLRRNLVVEVREEQSPPLVEAILAFKVKVTADRRKTK
jgi:hypothetical protein